MSIYTEDQLFNIDNKIKEMDVMVALFESKLNSLPSDVVSKYPQLKQVDLGDFSSDIFKFENIIPTNNLLNEQQVKGENFKEEAPTINIINNEVITIQENYSNTVDIKVEETPYEKLERLKRENPQLESLGMSLKVGIPSAGLSQNGIHLMRVACQCAMVGNGFGSTHGFSQEKVYFSCNVECFSLSKCNLQIRIKG